MESTLPNSTSVQTTPRIQQGRIRKRNQSSYKARYTALIINLLKRIRIRRRPSKKHRSSWIHQPTNLSASPSRRDPVNNTNPTMAVHPSLNSQQNTQSTTQTQTVNSKPSSRMPFKLSSKPSITITLTGRTQETSTYSTLDAIQGTASIAVKYDTSFRDLEIALIGTVTTMVDAAGRSGAMVGGESRATQQLLKVTQPIDWQSLGLESKIMRGGCAYDIPFTFVVPTQLSSRACTHRVASAGVRDAHLTLPPTMGDKKTISKLITPADFAPDGVEVEYAIQVRMVESQKKVLAKSSQKIKIIPAVEEAPPLSPDEDLPYVMRKEKTLKKNLFSGKFGRLAISADQPSSFKLPASDEETYDPTTYVRLSLRFDPSTLEAKPPSLGTLASKLLINTTYSTTSRVTLQYKVRNDILGFSDMTSDSITDELHLSSMALGNSTQWTQHDAKSRPASVVSMASSVCEAGKDSTIIEPTKSFDSRLPFYTASLLIPATIPVVSKKHTWIPSFQSCLVSRTYALQLVLSTASSSSASSSKLELMLPIQLSQRHTSNGRAILELARTQAEAALEAEEAFIARSTLIATTPTEVGIRRVGYPAVFSSVAEESMERPPEYAMLHAHDDQRVRTNGRFRF